MVKINKHKVLISGQEVEFTQTLHKCCECDEWYDVIELRLFFYHDKESEVYCPKGHIVRGCYGKI